MDYTSLSPTTKNGSWTTVALVVLGITTTCLIYQHRSSFSIVRNTVFQDTEEEVSTTREHITDEKDSAKDSGIIGHFGLGFYSAFMVAKKVEIITKSHSNKPAAHWTCDGSPEYTLEKSDKKSRL